MEALPTAAASQPPRRIAVAADISRPARSPRQACLPPYCRSGAEATPLCLPEIRFRPIRKACRRPRRCPETGVGVGVADPCAWALPLFEACDAD